MWWMLVGVVALLAVSGCGPRALRLAQDLSHFEATYIPSTGDTMAGPLAELTARLERWGVTLGELPAVFSEVGLTYRADRRILLRVGLSVDARFEVLAHEAGHLLQPPALDDDAVAQLFAELVGVGVQKFYGSRTADRTAAAYLAQFKWTFAMEPYLRRDIDYAVKVLTGQVPLPQWLEP